MVVALANFDDVIRIAFPILEMIIILRIYSPAELKKMFASLAQETLSQANSFSDRSKNS